VPHRNDETDDMKKRAIDGKLPIPSSGNAAKAGQQGVGYYPTVSAWH